MIIYAQQKAPYPPPSDLPLGYQALEYIDGNFKQVVVTDYQPTTLSYIKFTFFYDSTCIPSGNLQGVNLWTATAAPHENRFAVYSSSSGLGYVYARFISDNNYDAFWKGTTTAGNISDPTLLELYANNLLINGVKRGYNSISQTSVSYPPHKLCFFFDSVYNQYDINTRTTRYLPVLSKGRVYRFEAYKLQRSGNLSVKVLTHDYLPCLQLSSGLSGLYDAVNGVFHPLHTPIRVSAIVSSSRRITVSVSQAMAFPLYVSVQYTYSDDGIWARNVGVVLPAGSTSVTVAVSFTLVDIVSCYMTTDSNSFSEYDSFGEPVCFTDTLLLYNQ